MQTEISFLIDLVLNHKLPKPTKELCRLRIRDLEEGLFQRPAVAIAMPRMQQAPSTMANLEAQEVPIAMPTIETPKRIVGGEIATGANTKGPRKW